MKVVSSNCFVNLLVVAVLGSCVDELGTTRFHLWFGAVEQQHDFYIFFIDFH